MVVWSLLLTDFYQKVLVCLLHFRHRHLFRRSRPIPLPFLFGSCLNAHASPSELWTSVVQRMQSPLSVLFLALYLPFPFAFPLLTAPIAGLSSSRFLALK